MNMWQESQLRPFPAFVSLQTYSEVSVSILRTGFGEIIKYYWFSAHWFKGPPCTRPTKPQFPHTLEDDSELQGKKCMKYSCAHTLSNVWHSWDHPEIHADTRKTHKSQQKVHFSAEWQERKPGYSSLAVFQHAVLSLQCPSCNDLAAGGQQGVLSVALCDHCSTTGTRHHFNIGADCRLDFPSRLSLNLLRQDIEPSTELWLSQNLQGSTTWADLSI